MKKLLSFLSFFLFLVSGDVLPERGSLEWQQSRMYVHIEESQRDDFLNWIDEHAQVEWNGVTVSWVYRIVVDPAQRSNLLQDLKTKNFTKYATIYEDTVKRILDTEPNDPYYIEPTWGDGYYVWPHKNHSDPANAGSGGDFDMDSEKGWDISTDGSGVIVLVHDQGFRDTHEDFQGNLWNNFAEINGVEGVDDDNNGYVDDLHGYHVNKHGDHGTGVGGAVAARGNNGLGSVGSAWTAQLAHYSEAVWCQGDWQCIGGTPEAIDYANLIGAKIFNASYGYYCNGDGANPPNWGCIQSEEAVIDAFNGLFVAAAGNDSVDNDVYWNMPSSARNDHVVAVGALHQDGTNEFNYGATSVDVHGFASLTLGCGILPYCSADDSEGGTDDCYAIFGGTSCATPQTAGLLALRWTQCPDDTRLEVKQSLIDAAEELNSLSGMSISEGMNNMFNLLSAPCASSIPISLSFKGNPPSDIEEGDLSNKDNDVKVYFETNYPEENVSYVCQLNTSGWNSCTGSDTDGSYWESGELADGVWALTVRATHDDVQIGSVENTINWTLDSTPPDTVITSGPDNPTAETTAIFEFENTNSNENATTTFECRFDWNAFNDPPWESCTSPKTYSNISEGAHNFEVRAIDEAGNIDPSPPWFEWEIDIVPITTIHSGPDDPSISPDATFIFSSSHDPDTRYECKLDHTNWEAGNCLSPKTYTGLSEGVHVFDVRAIEVSGEEDVGETETWTWTIDFAPSVTISSGPDNPTNETSATFEFSSDDSNATFTCNLNGSGAVSCLSPYTYNSLQEGNYSFVVVATDAAGNTGTDTYAWVVDTTGPNPSIDSGPSDPTNETTATFEFTSDEESSFECLLDWSSGGTWEVCTSPKSYDDLSEGSHEFDLRATDNAGNVDTSSTWTWMIDTTEPETTIDSGPNPFDGSVGATFEFSSPSDNDSQMLFECSLDSGAWESCTSPKGYTNLSEESHHFSVRTIDLAGNIDSSPSEWNWTVDVTDPEATILSGPTDPSNEDSATFEFESNEPNSTFECQLVDVDGTESVGWHSCTSPAVFSDLESGPWYFEFKAIDQAGNEDASEEWHWTIDSEEPQTTITSGPSNPTNETAATFEFNSDDSNAIFKCSVNQGNWIPCISGWMTSPLGEGSHNFQVKAIDSAENEDSSPAEWNWEIDITEPNTGISSGPSNPSNDSTGDFVFIEMNAEEVSGFECKIDGGNWDACDSPYSTATLEDGPHSFEVRAIDLAGNIDSSPAAHAWTIDTQAPQTDITSGPLSPTTETTANFVFESNEGNSTFRCSLDSAVWEPCTSPKDYDNLEQGSHIFRVMASDLAGNEDSTPSEWNWIIDIEAPETTIDSSPGLLTNSDSGTFEFSSDEGNATFECKLDSAAWESCTSPRTYTSLTDGMYSFLVRSSDDLGNTDPTPAEWNWTVDITNPETTIVSGPDNPTSETSALFEFSSNEANSTFQCKLDSAAWESCTSPKTYPGLSFENHSFAVKATDEAGNEESTEETWDWLIEAQADVSIDSGPSEGEEIHDNLATFEFSSSNQDASFECQDTNNMSWTSCGDNGSGSYTTSALEDGNHVFNVRAVVNGSPSGTDGRNFIVDAVDDIFISHENPIEETTIDLPPGGIDKQPIFRFGYEKIDGPPGDDNYLNQVTLKASGTGNDEIDISKVEIWLDMDENGQPDNPQNNLGESVFMSDNGSLTISLVNHTNDVSFSSKVFYLVTYDFYGEDNSASNPFDIETLLAFMFMGVVFSRKKRIAGMLMVLFFVTSCGGGGGGGNQKTNHTYSVSIENHSDVSSNEDSLIQLESSPITSNETTIRK